MTAKKSKPKGIHEEICDFLQETRGTPVGRVFGEYYRKNINVEWKVIYLDMLIVLYLEYKEEYCNKVLIDVLDLMEEKAEIMEKAIIAENKDLSESEHKEYIEDLRQTITDLRKICLQKSGSKLSGL